MLLIVGLRNNRCRETVANALESVRGVRYVQVNLYRATGIVIHDDACRPAALIRAVKVAGYGASIMSPNRARPRAEEGT